MTFRAVHAIRVGKERAQLSDKLLTKSGWSKTP